MNPTVRWSAIQPEVIVAITLAVVFVADLFLSNARRRFLTPLALSGVFAATVALIVFGVDHAHDVISANSVYVVDPLSSVAKGIFLTSTAFVLLLGVSKAWKGEYIELMLASLLGMMLVVSARDLVLFFVAFELFAVPGFLLTGWRKKSEHGHEGLLKYYLLGVIASAIMLYGLSILFGLAGDTSYEAISKMLDAGGSEVAYARIAVLFVVVGLAFKVSAVPFHFWAPDAYQSAPIPVAAFLSVVMKAVGIFAIFIVCTTAFEPASTIWAPVILVLSIATMTLGNVVALRQSDLVRLLAYSSIAQAGYLLLPLAVAIEYGGSVSATLQATVVYLVIYSLANLAAFGVVVHLAQRHGTTSVNAAPGLFAASPLMALALVASLVSLAGIPPFGGWFAKLVVFKAGIDAGSDQAIALVVIAAINSAIGLVYYANVVQKCWSPPESASDVQSGSRVARPLGFALIVLTAATLAAGVLPLIATRIGEWATVVG